MATVRPTRIRQRRIELGLSQAELARSAGVSRQLVAAVEAGRNTPAVDAAIALAQALTMSVEELFTAPGAVAAVPAIGPIPPGRALVRLGRVGDQLVAAPLDDQGSHGNAWATPDALIDAGQVQIFDGARPAGLVIAGCDPVLGVAETLLGGLGARSLLAISAPTGVALDALARGHIHAAAVHGPPDGLPTPPVGVKRWQLTRWQVGLGTAPGISGDAIEALAAQGPIVQRQAAAASQQTFRDAAHRAGLDQPVVGPIASGHIDAARTAAMLTATAVTTEAAAHAFDLRFVPLQLHTVEIWLAEPWAQLPAADALAQLLSSRGFVQRAAQFAGYDLTDCGRAVVA